MLTIVPVGPSDQDRILEWRNRPDVRQWMYTDRVITQEAHASWFSRLLADPGRRYWVISWQSRGVGVVHLAEFSHQHSRCKWGIYLGEASARGSGAAEGAAFLSLDFAFGQLLLDRVSCEALSDNRRAVALYERVGFRREAFVRSYVRKGDERFDVVSLGLLRQDWAALRSGLLARLSKRGVLGAEVGYG